MSATKKKRTRVAKLMHKLSTTVFLRPKKDFFSPPNQQTASKHEGLHFYPCYCAVLRQFNVPLAVPLPDSLCYFRRCPFGSSVPFPFRPLQAVRRPSAQRTQERRPSSPSPPGEVVRSGEPQGEDELPPPNTTRSMAAIFRSLESQGGPPPTPESSKRLQARAREQSGANNTVRLPGAPGCAAADYNDETPMRHHNGNGDLAADETAENEPLELDPDVVRNGEPASMEELPERGTTRNLLAIFKSMEQAERAWGVCGPDGLHRQSVDGVGLSVWGVFAYSITGCLRCGGSAFCVLCAAESSVCVVLFYCRTKLTIAVYSCARLCELWKGMQRRNASFSPKKNATADLSTWV